MLSFCLAKNCHSFSSITLPPYFCSASVHREPRLLASVPVRGSGRELPLPLAWVPVSVLCVRACACVYAKLLQSCLTLCDPMDCSASGSPVHRILQARILEWVAILFSRRFSRSRLNPSLPHCRQVLYRLSHQGSLALLSNYIS